MISRQFQSAAGAGATAVRAAAAAVVSVRLVANVVVSTVALRERIAVARSW